MTLALGRKHIRRTGEALTLAHLREHSVETERGCWQWQRHITSEGYGMVTHNGKQRGVHVVAYVLDRGEPKPGHFVLHDCDNRACCNPAHLWAGTQSDNMQDMLSKGRGAWQTKKEASPWGEAASTRRNRAQKARLRIKEEKEISLLNWLVGD